MVFMKKEQKTTKDTDICFAVNNADYRYNGFIDDAARYIEEFQLLNEPVWNRFAAQFGEDADYEAGWRGEYWGKMMRGASLVFAYTKNEKLYSVLTNAVKSIMSYQDENGRISSYGINHEFDGWDLWCRKYVLLGMQYYMEICRDSEFKNEIIKSMCRQLDYIISKIGNREEGKKPITEATRHWRGVNSSSILEPVMKLFRITNVKKYFDFAKYIVDCGGTDVENLIDLAYQNRLYPYQYPVTKAYEMISFFEGVIEYYNFTKEEKYKKAVINFADKILESDFTVIGSCGCTHELFDHSKVRQANTTNGKIMQETCVTVTIMKFMYRLLLLTGNSKYTDAFEISLYNAYLGAINTEKNIEPSLKDEHPDWCLEPLPFDSYSPLTSGTRGNGIGGLKLMSDNHYYGCCACIGAAGIGLVPKVNLLRTNKGFMINLFINGTVHTETATGSKILFETVTDYPKGGSVKIILHIEKAEEFELVIRNPYWSKCTEFVLNGKKIDSGNENIIINRVWNDGDKIEIKLDMRTEAIYPEPYGHQILMNKVIWGHNYIVPTYDEEDVLAKHHIALRRGPVMFAQESRLGYDIDSGVKIKVDREGYADVKLPSNDKAPYPHIVEAQVQLDDGTFMTVTDYASAGKLWTEESKMAVWMLTK